MANWFQRFYRAIEREYERRVRRASQVTEYGAHAPAHHDKPDQEEQDDGMVEIVNVPRGTSFRSDERDNHHGEPPAP